MEFATLQKEIATIETNMKDQESNRVDKELDNKVCEELQIIKTK